MKLEDYKFITLASDIVRIMQEHRRKAVAIGDARACLNAEDRTNEAEENDRIYAILDAQIRERVEKTVGKSTGEFITGIQTHNSGGHMMVDLITLQSGIVLGISEDAFVEYESLEAYQESRGKLLSGSGFYEHLE